MHCTRKNECRLLRPAVIYVTGGKINENYEKLEELKAYCADIVKEEISVKADSDNLGAAQELVEYILDEFDDELDDAEEFAL